MNDIKAQDDHFFQNLNNAKNVQQQTVYALTAIYVRLGDILKELSR